MSEDYNPLLKPEANYMGSSKAKTKKYKEALAWLNKYHILFREDGSAKVLILTPDGQPLFDYNTITQHWYCHMGEHKGFGNFFHIVKEHTLFTYLTYYRERYEAVTT